MIRAPLVGLVKSYDRVAVVDGASLEIGPANGSHLLGPSGAGKSTLARLVAGLEPSTAARFLRRPDDPDPARPRARVGLVFQDDALWPRLTVARTWATP